MEKITEALAIGLKEEEIKVYLASLELGAASVLNLSKKTDIPRSTIYLIIESLAKKGLITQSALGKRKRFLAQNPDNLLKLALQTQKEAQKAIEDLKKELPQLTAIYNLKIEKPKVRYYEGVEGVKEIYEDSINYRQILVHCMTQKGMKIMGGYLEKYLKRVIRRGIKTKEIVSDTPLDRKYQKKYSTSRNKIIYIPKKYTTNTDCFIYGDKIAMITYRGGKPVGILIEDKELANFEKIRFKILWKAAKAKIL